MKRLMLVFALLVGSNAYAGYNANFSGKVTAALTYSGKHWGAYSYGNITPALYKPGFSGNSC